MQETCVFRYGSGCTDLWHPVELNTTPGWNRSFLRMEWGMEMFLTKNTKKVTKQDDRHSSQNGMEQKLTIKKRQNDLAKGPGMERNDFKKCPTVKWFDQICRQPLL